MSKEDTVIRFDRVSFKYNDNKVTLDDTSFNIRRNSKITIMGQNGAGKSTLFKLMLGQLTPQKGQIHIDQKATVAIAEQMVPKEKLQLSVKEYFETAFPEKNHKIEKDIAETLEIVNLNVSLDKKVDDLSGGQQARLLLAYALIQNPDILLLDEPTNNLDQEGIDHLTYFLIMYPKTVVVISHDADFLSSFTDGVLNLDVHTHKIEQFVGDYYDVLNQIEAHLEKQRLQNARIEKSIRDRFEKVNKLGGKSVAMRRLANKVRADIEEDRENIVELRREDRTIPEFEIPNTHYPYPLIKINKISFMKDHKPMEKEVNIEIRRGHKLLISGPNGVGKSTLLKALIEERGAEIGENVKVGYYSQDFSELDYDQTAFDSLAAMRDEIDSELIYGTAGRFLLSGSVLQQKIADLSEGQKGLLCYARFMLQEPGLLIMDEPTNHINFRHIPVIAKALQDYKGGLIVISHLPDFVKQIRIDEILDLGKYANS